MIYLPTFWMICIVNVDTYTSPMDGMGHGNGENFFAPLNSCMIVASTLSQPCTPKLIYIHPFH